MSLRLSFEDVAGEVFDSPHADHLKCGIPVGTFIPDSELAPSRATGKVILRHRRLVFFTFDELGNPKWEARELNYLGEPMSKVCPGVVFTTRNCRGNRNTDLFCEFRDMELVEFEREAFKFLAAKHQLDEEWNWPTYDIMRAEPYRRSLRQVQQERLEQGNYAVPTFNHNGLDDARRRESFLNRLEGIVQWEMDNKFAINTRWNHKSVEYAQERFLLASRAVDLFQKLLHDTQIACASDLSDTSYVPRVAHQQQKEAPAPGSLGSPFDIPEEPVWSPVGGQQIAAASTPGSAISPYPVPRAPFSTPVRMNDPQHMSTPTPNRNIRRMSGMDCAPDDHLPPSRQTGQLPPEPTTPTHTQSMNFDAGAQAGEVPWYPRMASTLRYLSVSSTLKSPKEMRGPLNHGRLAILAPDIPRPRRSSCRMCW
ncbi:uncharacterized protein N7496_006181 [Penicillium cataractarum]|uniref:Uncharacterized protein n=1 Tax=Penicillium cataractarum TaxID=2100454 RepID=A0A9W9V762_9EURO|nr:uncharacterized protein N7496_006181 [Penicillium cataractarum]KAJ5370089.1 hypothetical protein N7496_006181 [Penicillium cataractarum]